MNITKQENQRDDLFDNLRVFLIFCVVFGHFLELIMKGNAFYQSLHAILYSFHMPLFVFISGYFSKNTKETIFYNMKILLLPYLIFSTAASAISGHWSLLSILVPEYAFWYFLSLFYWRVFAKNLKKIRFIFPLSLAVAILAGLISQMDRFMSLSRTLVFLPFFVFGLLWTQDKTQRLKKRPKTVFVLIGLLCATAVSITSAAKIFPNELYRQAQSYRETGLSPLEGIFFRSASLTIAFALIFTFVRLISCKKNKYSYIGQRTISIFVFHALLVLIIKQCFAERFTEWSRFPVILPLCLLLSFALVWLFSRNWSVKTYHSILRLFSYPFENRKIK